MSNIRDNYQLNDGKNWYVLYTRPRSEKKVANQLQRMGLESYCPVRNEMRQWSDRRKKVEVPVLPSMILVHVPSKDRKKVFDCPNAVRYLFWEGQPAEVPEGEVKALEQSLTGPRVISHESIPLRPGQHIDMTEWGFKNEEGRIKYMSGNHCWIVLKNIGMVVKLKIEK